MQETACTETQENLFEMTWRGMAAKHKQVIMGKIKGKYICGQRMGPNFLQSMRVSLSDECPLGFKPCSVFTRREHTLCVEEGKSRGENCPITGVSFVKKGGKPQEVFPHG